MLHYVKTSTKPEVHNVCIVVIQGPSYGRENMYRKFREVWTRGCWDMQVDRQTDRQSDMLITILITIQYSAPQIRSTILALY